MHVSHKYLKRGILAISLIGSLGIYYFFHHAYPVGSLAAIRIEEWYGFLSLIFLFLTMLAGPLYRVFPNAPLKSYYRGSLGGFGISAGYFALLHSWITSFSLLGGFRGITFLHSEYQIAVIAGFISLFILVLLAATSFTFAMKALGPRWKTLHRFVYLAAFAVLVHVVIIGGDYHGSGALAYDLTFVAVAVLLLLHGAALKTHLASRLPRISSLWLAVIIHSSIVVILGGLIALHLIVHH